MAIKLEEKLNKCDKCDKQTKHHRNVGKKDLSERIGCGSVIFILLNLILCEVTNGLWLAVFIPLLLLIIIFKVLFSKEEEVDENWYCSECGQG